MAKNNCEFCSNPEEAKKKQRELIKTHGWIIHYVSDDIIHPYKFNAHTHGLSANFKHLDFQIVIPTPSETIQGIFNNLFARIGHGDIFEHGKDYSDILGAGYKVRMLKVKESDRDVLRLVFPDKDGNLDKDKLNEYFLKQYD